MKAKRTLLTTVLCVLLLLTGCREKGESLPAGYNYSVQGRVLVGMMQDSRDTPLAFTADSGTAPLPVTACNLFGRTVYYSTAQDGGVSWIAAREEDFTLLGGAYANEGYLLTGGVLYAVSTTRAERRDEAEALLDCNENGVLYQKDGTLYFYNGEAHALGAGEDGWLCGEAVVLLHDGTWYLFDTPDATPQTAVIAPELARYAMLRGTTMCVALHHGGGISVYEPFTQHMGLLDLTDLCEPGTTGTVTLPVSPNGEFLLLEDYEFLYRISMYDDTISVVPNTMLGEDGVCTYDSRCFLTDDTVIYAQRPSEQTEFEATVYRYVFEDEVLPDA